MTKEYYQKHKEEILKKNKEYQESHKEEIKAYQKQYKKEHPRKSARQRKSAYDPDYQKQYREEHRKEAKSYWKEWYSNNRQTHIEHNKEYVVKNSEKVSEYQKQYNQTKEGRASKLITGYKTADKRHNRKGFDLTREWVIEHIFNSSCVYCGESDWHLLGCDRIDNTKAHTTDNVVCACKSCNIKRQKKDFKSFLLSQNPSSSLLDVVLEVPPLSMR